MRSKVLLCAATIVVGTMIAEQTQALTMQECAVKYKAAQVAGTLNGMNWNDFRTSQCAGVTVAVPLSPTTRTVPERPSFSCTEAKTPAARLICSDAELAALDKQLGEQFQKRKSQLAGSDQLSFVRDEVTWIRDRNKQCELVGKDNVETEALVASKPCMVNAIRARIAALAQNGKMAVAEPVSENKSIVPAPQMAGVGSPEQSAALQSAGHNKYSTMVKDSIVEHWKVPTGTPSDKFTIRLNLSRDGNVVGPVNVYLQEGPGEPALRDSILNAVFAAAPFKGLPQDSYGSSWQEFELTMDPEAAAALVQQKLLQEAKDQGFSSTDDYEYFEKEQSKLSRSGIRLEPH